MSGRETNQRHRGLEQAPPSLLQSQTSKQQRKGTCAKTTAAAAWKEGS
jgi:hypothetical protein